MTKRLNRDDMRYHIPGESLPEGFKKHADGENGDPDVIVRQGSPAAEMSVIAFSEAFKDIPKGQNSIELDA